VTLNSSDPLKYKEREVTYELVELIAPRGAGGVRQSQSVDINLGYFEGHNTATASEICSALWGGLRTHVINNTVSWSQIQDQYFMSKIVSSMAVINVTFTMNNAVYTYQALAFYNNQGVQSLSTILIGGSVQKDGVSVADSAAFANGVGVTSGSVEQSSGITNTGSVVGDSTSSAGGEVWCFIDGGSGAALFCWVKKV
jgi:hypothetical protein